MSVAWYAGGPDMAAPRRRDFLYVASGIFGVAGAVAAAWPFVHSMNPSAEVLALASVELDLAPLKPGQRLTAEWRGKPLFVVRRTAEEIARARTDDDAELPDPEADADRVERNEWLIMVGVCTHLGCIPLGQRATDRRGEWDGWFCPCHGSHYDTSGRIRKGPAPKNLVVPAYEFLSDTELRVG